MKAITAKQRVVAFLLVLVQLVLLMSACNGSEKTTTGATTEAPTTQNKVETPTTERPTTERPTTETPTTEAPVPSEEEFFFFAIDGEPQFEIVYSDAATNETIDAVYAFADELEEITGAFFYISSDATPPVAESELLVGAFANRDEIREATKQATYTSAYIDVVEDTIVVSPYTDQLGLLLRRLTQSLYEIEEGVWGIERELIPYMLDAYHGGIPCYDTVEGVMMGGDLYTFANVGYTVGYAHTNRDEFDAYLKKLEAMDYELYTTETLGRVEYFTYVKGNDTLHVQFIGEWVGDDSGESVKITWSEDEWLPPVGDSEPYETLVDSSINNIARVPGAGGWGMGMIFQIADGSFIIVDGALNTAADQEALLRFMQENKPAEHERPIVSCWLWTHAHGDHVDLCLNALPSYADKVDVKMFAYNYPNFNEVPSAANAGEYYSQGLIRLTQKCYPDAIHWIMHGGQKYAIADTVIQCWWTHEDVYPLTLYGVNDTVSVFSITIDGIRTMMLGDCENPNSKMISYFRKDMKSPVVQNSHHTINGPKAMYEYIDPIYSFWACSEAEVTARSKTEHAQYLLKTQWSRVDASGKFVTGNRHHYNNTWTTRLYIKDLKKAVGDLT